MNATEKKIVIPLAVAVLFAGAAIANAQISPGAAISININPADQGTQTQMAPTDVAGAPGVAAGYWNSLAVSGNGNGYIGGSMSNLLDNSGAATTLNASAGAIPGGSGAWDTNFSNYGWNGADLTMHTGGLEYDPQITISDVAYALYDIYVYLGGGANGGNAGGEISLSSLDENGAGVDPTQYQFFGYSWSGNNTYTQITSTDPASPGSGNYVLFTGNSASSFTVNYESFPNDQWNGGVTGIEIVSTAPVPEPATPSLAALGVASLAFAGFHSRRKFPARS